MPDTIAAIDLGSNSFHMIVARPTEDGHLQVLDRLREMVQLNAGLDSKNRLSEESQARALDCLARFGQRLSHIHPSRVRIVGTNTLRQARNSDEFLARVEAVTGHPVEVVSGVEEARLIYLGVAHSIVNVGGQRLVVDIGGGSTELIIGERFEPLHLESLGIGCVNMNRKHFTDGRVRESNLRAAELEVAMEMEPIAAAYQELGWTHVIGSSGTIKAIRDAVNAEGWSHDGITHTALHRLRAALLDAGKISAIAARWHLHPARAQVFTSGFTVLHGICEALGVKQLHVSDGALREGLIYDLIGRIRHEDVRHRTIADLSRRFDLDGIQAERVTATALHLLAQAKAGWKLEDDEFAYQLEWAARLHEIGLAIAHSHYHKHGGYVLAHADLPGFSRSVQGLLAVLVRGHRRKFPTDVFQDLPQGLAMPARRLCVLLRLAVLLHRSRSRQPPPPVGLHAADPNIDLTFPPGWLEAHPLTHADLTVERDYLKKAGFNLSFAAVVESSLAQSPPGSSD